MRKLAEKHEKIMNLHFRGTEKEGFEMLQIYNIKTAIFHGYIRSLKYIDDISSAGYYYSVSKMDLIN